MRSFFLKRALDLAVAVPLLIVTAPVMAVVAVLVARKLGRPVLFNQARPGLNGRIFNLYKFRTMKVGDGPDAERMTDFGRFLRKTSLDELPQLLNVVKGDISLVGPRPLLVEYLPFYTAEENARHGVLPGITGLAQINGRNATSWEDRLRYDADYARTWSNAGDLKILLATVLKVLSARDTNAPGHVTMPRFDDYCIQQGRRKSDVATAA